jgi:choline kinase
MKSVALVILAAGIGSRFGGSKQTASFGPSGESLMEFSIYDAIQAGFNKIVLVVRNDMLAELKTYLSTRIPNHINLRFVIQNTSTYVPPHIQSPRTKPWGTGHALLCCKEEILEPFGLINADDFYGRDAIKALYDFIVHQNEADKYALVAYALDKVLSDNGPVSRGILKTSNDDHLLEITEYRSLIKKNNEVKSQGDDTISLSLQTLCSMNCWALHPALFETAQYLFEEFLIHHAQDADVEFYMPSIIGSIIEKNNRAVKVIPGGNIWCGVTYPEDKISVQTKINSLITDKHYPKNLWIDLI